MIDDDDVIFRVPLIMHRTHTYELRRKVFVLLLEDIVKLGLQSVTFRTQEVVAFARLLPVVI